VVPVEPPPSTWRLPPADAADEHGIVGIGADLEPGTLLAAYRGGIFPMPLHRTAPMAWWSPDPRAVLPLDGLRVSRSLRRSRRRYEVRVDTAFHEVVAACADPGRPDGWITPEIHEAYSRLHRLGWAHSVEAWDDEGLAGGLYGVATGGLFAGESMFRRRTDASKVALVGLVELLAADGTPGRLLDVQWRTDHLASLGAVEVPRRRYLDLLDRALQLPLPLALVDLHPQHG
jgi:leucyl/phenylalanyl-tRNA---protein transferase